MQAPITSRNDSRSGATPNLSSMLSSKSAHARREGWGVVQTNRSTPRSCVVSRSIEPRNRSGCDSPYDVRSSSTELCVQGGNGKWHPRHSPNAHGFLLVRAQSKHPRYSPSSQESLLWRVRKASSLHNSPPHTECRFQLQAPCVGLQDAVDCHDVGRHTTGPHERYHVRRSLPGGKGRCERVGGLVQGRPSATMWRISMVSLPGNRRCERVGGSV